MLYIKFSGLTYCMIGNLYPGINISSFPPLPDAAVAAKSLQSCPTLCNPIDGSPPGSPVLGILQARILEWVAISFSNAWKWKVKEKSLIRVLLLATSWTAAYQAPPYMGFSTSTPYPMANTILLWAQHFKILHINNIIQCLHFAVWLISFNIMLSSFIHVVSTGRISFFLRLSNIHNWIFLTH